MPVLNRDDLASYLPHKNNALILDQVEIKDANNAMGQVFLTNDKWFFNGHFPDQPVMPGVIIIEAIAQTAGVLINFKHKYNNLGLLVSINSAKFKKIITPDQKKINLQVSYISGRHGLYKFDGQAMVKDILYAKTIISLTNKSFVLDTCAYNTANPT